MSSPGLAALRPPAAALTVVASCLAAASTPLGDRAAVALTIVALAGATTWLAAEFAARTPQRDGGARFAAGPFAVAAVGSLLAAGALILAGPGAALLLAVAVLVGVWWFEGPREGRRLREALFTAVALALAANFISSWLGLVAGLPVGALARDLAFGVLLAASAGRGADESGAVPRLLAYAAVVAVVVASLETAGGLPAVVGARTYLLYPILLLAPAWRLPDAERLIVVRGVVLMLAAVAVLGLVEVATRGDVLSSLGFRTDFAETATTQASPYFAGFRRATGGLGNFLEFGFVMNIALLLARASLRGPLRGAAIALFAIAAFLSWSRLSWALVIIIALIPLAGIGRGRIRLQPRRLAGGVLIVFLVGAFLAFGPSQVVRDRLAGSDRVTQRSNTTREAQLTQALSDAGLSLTGTGPGTQGAAADRRAGGLDRLVTDNGYLIWLFELGWFGVVAMSLLSILVASALIAARAWWALVLLLILAVANTLFAASDSRIVLILGFISVRILWPERSPIEAPPGDETAPVSAPRHLAPLLPRAPVPVGGVASTAFSPILARPPALAVPPGVVFPLAPPRPVSARREAELWKGLAENEQPVLEPAAQDVVPATGLAPAGDAPEAPSPRAGRLRRRAIGGLWLLERALALAAFTRRGRRK